MLSVVTCDAPVTPEVWRGMFKRGAVNSFNQVQCSSGVVGQQGGLLAQRLRILSSCKGCPVHAPLPSRLPCRPAHPACLHPSPLLFSSRYTTQITVDGDTSTNDTVIGLTSGAAGGAGAQRACLAVAHERAWLSGTRRRCRAPRHAPMCAPHIPLLASV